MHVAHDLSGHTGLKFSKMQGKKYIKSSEFGQDFLAYISKKIKNYEKKLF